MLQTPARVRVLGRQDLPAVRQVLDRDPVTYVFVDHRVRVTNLDPNRLGGQMWGYDEGGRLASVCHAGANLIPVQADAAAIEAFAAHALREGRTCSAILGPNDAVCGLWRLLEPSWGPARAMRLRQPFLTLSSPPLVERSPYVRRVRADELDVLYPACVAMFTEELGISPEASGGEGMYRARIAQLIAKGQAFAHIDDGRVLFKAEVAAVTPRAGQVQGVWIDPSVRGQGLAAPSMAAVAELVMRDLAPVVSLYVNHHNEPARRAYARVGFTEHGRFATILF